MRSAPGADLPRALSDRVCLVVQGVRRCGKSTLLQQLVGHYGLDPARCAFVNFEDPRLSNALSFELLPRPVARLRQRGTTRLVIGSGVRPRSR